MKDLWFWLFADSMGSLILFILYIVTRSWGFFNGWWN